MLAGIQAFLLAHLMNLDVDAAALLGPGGDQQPGAMVPGQEAPPLAELLAPTEERREGVLLDALATILWQARDTGEGAAAAAALQRLVHLGHQRPPDRHHCGRSGARGPGGRCHGI